jgi:transcriptional regulator of acetoin/glycerol metabolism
MDRSTLEFQTARDAYFSDGTVPRDGLVRPVIFGSWRRSKFYGLNQDGILPARTAQPRLEGQLQRAARPVVERARSSMRDVALALTLTDERGYIVENHVNNGRLQRKLEARNLLPGISIAESAVGTCATGIALETGSGAFVVGAEHFPTSTWSMATAGAAIRHPLTRRVLGTIALTCGIDDASPVMLSWIEDQAAKIERFLLDAVTAAEKQLFNTFMTVNRDTRHPVICVNDRTVISNASAARLVVGVDQTLLWEMASSSVSAGEDQSFEIIVPESDTPVEVRCIPISNGEKMIGATLHLGRTDASSARRSGSSAPSVSTREAQILPGLAGESVAWLEFCRRVRLAGEANADTLLIGAAGTGKTAVLGDLALTMGDVQLIDLGTSSLHDVQSALERSRPVLIDNLHVQPDAFRLVGAHLRQEGDRPRVIATALWDGDALDDSAASDFAHWPGKTAQIPALRERVGDLPRLLDALTARRVPLLERPSWSAEAVQTLSRVPWAANVSTLGKLVTSVLRRQPGQIVRREHLPTEVLSHAARRRVYGLEYFEVQAITAALKASGGNKKVAAEKLGIARSTLYRKVRVLGIDLAGTFY